MRRLQICQTFDPGRGSFMVHPLGVNEHGRPKMVKDRRGNKQYVFLSANDISYNSRGAKVITPHPEAYEFIVEV